MSMTLFEQHGIRFQYPEDWELEVNDDDDGAVTTVSLNAPDGLAFALVTVDEDRPTPAEVVDEALGAMREEYPTLDATPAMETIAGQRAVGYDIEFISLDLTNACAIRAFRTERKTVTLFCQWSDIEDEEVGAVLVGLRRSFVVLDGEIDPE